MPLSVDAFCGCDELSVILTGCSMEVEPVVVNLDSGDCARVQSTEMHVTPWAASFGWGSTRLPKQPRHNAWVASLPALLPDVTEARLLVVADGQQHRCKVIRHSPEPEPAPLPPAPAKRRGRARKAV